MKPLLLTFRFPRFWRRMPVMTAAALAGLALLLGCASTGIGERDMPALRTAAVVDLSRYTGQWYEVARLPNSFQRDDSWATATYSIESENLIRVMNTEYHADGTRRSISGRATIVPDSRGSRLRVTFSGFAGLVPASSGGNYWIIDVAGDYSVALVGTPDRKNLWLLSRRANLPAATRQHYLNIALEEGFDTTRVLVPDWSRAPLASRREDFKLDFRNGPELTSVNLPQAPLCMR